MRKKPWWYMYICMVDSPSSEQACKTDKYTNLIGISTMQASFFLDAAVNHVNKKVGSEPCQYV